MYMPCFPQLGTSSPSVGKWGNELGAPVVCSGSPGRSHQGRFCLKLTFKLSGGYGGGGPIRLLFLVLWPLCFTVRLNKWISWLTPACLLPRLPHLANSKRTTESSVNSPPPRVHILGKLELGVESESGILIWTTGIWIIVLTTRPKSKSLEVVILKLSKCERVDGRKSHFCIIILSFFHFHSLASLPKILKLVSIMSFYRFLKTCSLMKSVSSHLFCVFFYHKCCS